VHVLPTSLNESLGELVSEIVKKQREQGDYPYFLHEQRVIDELVYRAYGLDEDDRKEVENWSARRYPELVAAKRRMATAAGVDLDAPVEVPEEDEATKA